MPIVRIERMIVRQEKGVPPVSGRYDHLPHLYLIPQTPGKKDDGKPGEEKKREPQEQFPHTAVIQQAKKDQESEKQKDRTAQGGKAGSQADSQKEREPLLAGHHRQCQTPYYEGPQKSG